MPRFAIHFRPPRDPNPAQGVDHTGAGWGESGASNPAGLSPAVSEAPRRTHVMRGDGDRAIFQGLTPLSRTDLFDQTTPLDLDNLSLILANMSLLKVQNGKLVIPPH